MAASSSMAHHIVGLLELLQYAILDSFDDCLNQWTSEPQWLLAHSSSSLYRCSE
jgi:hypothetical protein